MKKILLMLFFVLFATVRGTTYYIDYATGSDANNGTSKATPWKRAPGMNGATENVTNYQTAHNNPQGTVPAGDSFIFKGGVTWPNDCFCWHWIYGGGTGWTVGVNAVYFGIDQTWYSGGSWSRPIFDAEGRSVTNNGDMSNGILRVYKNSEGYFIIDNLEFIGLYQLNSDEMRMLAIDATIAEVKNCYFHGWGHGPVVNTGPCNTLGDGVTYAICNKWTSGTDSGEYSRDQFRVLTGPYGTDADDIKIHHCYIDGSDASPSSGNMGAATKGFFNHFYNNYVTHTQNIITSNFCDYVWGNTFIENSRITKLASDVHSNVYQSYGGDNRVSYVYNNFVKYTSGGATFLWYPTNTSRFYAFNNVVFEDSNLVIQLGNTQMTSNTNTAGFFIFNNTLQCVSSNNWSIINGSPTGYRFSNFFIKNNHFISGLKSINIGVNDGYVDDSDTGSNIFNNRAEAVSNGYLTTSTYPLFPPVNGSTVGIAQNIDFISDSLIDLGPSCPTTDFLYDATLGVSINTINHTVVYPNRSPILRGQKWDIGAYEYFNFNVKTKTKTCVLEK